MFRTQITPSLVYKLLFAAKFVLFFIILFTQHRFPESFRKLLLHTQLGNDNIYTSQGIAKYTCTSSLHFIGLKALHFGSLETEKKGFHLISVVVHVKWSGSHFQSPRRWKLQGNVGNWQPISKWLSQCSNFHKKSLLFTLLLSFLYYTLARQ